MRAVPKARCQARDRLPCPPALDVQFLGSLGGVGIESMSLGRQCPGVPSPGGGTWMPHLEGLISQIKIQDTQLNLYVK